MNCPNCAAEMQTGIWSIPTGLPDLSLLLSGLVGGGGGPTLCFTAIGDDRKLSIDYGQNQRAFGCRDCGSIVVLGGRTPAETKAREEHEAVLMEFSEAIRLEQSGNWDQALAVYEGLAAKLQGEDGAYARNCAEQVRMKQARAGSA
jgi:hypothetical protein